MKRAIDKKIQVLPRRNEPMTFWSLVQPAFFFPNETEAQSSRRAYQFLFNSEMFSPVWSTVHMYPVKMVTKNTSFLSKVKNFWKRRFLVYLWTDEDGGSLG